MIFGHLFKINGRLSLKIITFDARTFLKLKSAYENFRQLERASCASKGVAFILFALLSTAISFGHGVQLRWNIDPNTGAIKVWVEHWHGDVSGTSYTTFPLNVSYTINGTTTTQTYNATGYANNTAVGSLHSGGNTSTLLSACSNANSYNDWVTWDFNPPACNTPVSLTIIDGPSYLTSEGCSNLYPQTITSSFNDNTGPAITCSDLYVTPTNTSNCSAVVPNFGISAADACGGSVTTTYSIAQGSTFAQGSTPVTVTSTDQCGNVSTCTFNVIVGDLQAPTILTQNVTVPLVNGSASITAAQINNGSYDQACGGIGSMTVSPSVFSCSDLGANQVTLTVTDIFGNVGTGSATVTVTENINPVIACVSDLAVNANPGECDAVVTYTSPTATDNCGGANVQITQIAGLASGSVFPIGTTTNTFVASDLSGNSDTCSFDVTVSQPTPLGIDAGDTLYVCAGDTAQLNATLINPPSGSNSSNASTTVCIYDAPGGNPCSFGTSSLCNDGYQYFGSSTTTSTTVNISGVPNSIDFEAFYTSCGNPTFTFLVNGNPIGSFTPAYSCTCYPPASTYPSVHTFNSSQFSQFWNTNGSNTIGYTVSDLYVSGVRATLQFSSESYAWSGANLNDSSASSVTAVPTTSGLYTVNYSNGSGCSASDDVYVVVNPLPAVTNGNLTAISLYAAPFALATGTPAGGVYSGTGVSNGNTFDPSIAGVGTHTITYTYADGNGCSNSADGTIEVIPCNISSSATTSNVSCPGGNDGTIDLTVAGAIGTFSVSWTGPNGFTASTEDLSGLADGVYTANILDSATCTDAISVTVSTTPDVTAPTVVTRDVTVVLDAYGSGSVTANAVDSASTDACGVANLSLDQTSFGCADVGANTVTLTVTDNNGNAATGTATVTVEDNTAPTAMAQNATVVLDGNGTGTILGSTPATTLFLEDLTSLPSNYYANTNVSQFYVTGGIDLGNWIAGIAGNEIDLAGFANAQIESSSITLSPGDYTFSFQHQTNTNPNPNNSVQVILGSLVNQTFASSTSVQTETVSFTVGTTTSLTIKMVQLGPNDASGSFIGQIKLEEDASSGFAIEAGSSDACGIASIAVSDTTFDCSN